MAELIGQTDEFKDKLAGIGTSFDELLDTQGDLKSFADIIGIFEAKGYGAAEMVEIFGKRAGPGLAALIQMGSASLKEFTADLEAAGGTAALMAEIQLDTLSGQMTILKGSFSLLATTIGETLLPVLQKIVQQGIIPMINKWVDWVEGVKPYIVAGFETIYLYITKNREALVFLLKQFLGFAKIVGMLWLVSKAIHLMTSPIYLMIALAGALYVAWRANLLGIQEAAEKVGRVLLDVVAAPIKLILTMTGHEESAKNIGDFISNLSGSIAGLAGIVGGFLLGKWLIKGLLGKIGGAVLAGNVLTLGTLAIAALLAWDIKQSVGEIAKGEGWPSMAKLAAQAIGAITGGIIGAAVGHPIVGGALGAYAFGWAFEGLLKINWDVLQDVKETAIEAIAEPLHDLGTKVYEATSGLIDIRVSDSEGIKAMTRAAEEQAAAIEDFPDTSDMDLKFEWVDEADKSLQGLPGTIEDLDRAIEDLSIPYWQRIDFPSLPGHATGGLIP